MVNSVVGEQPVERGDNTPRAWTSLLVAMLGCLVRKRVFKGRDSQDHLRISSHHDLVPSIYTPRVAAGKGAAAAHGDAAHRARDDAAHPTAVDGGEEGLQ